MKKEKLVIKLFFYNSIALERSLHLPSCDQDNALNRFIEPLFFNLFSRMLFVESSFSFEMGLQY